LQFPAKGCEIINQKLKPVEPFWPDDHELIKATFGQSLPLKDRAPGHAQQPCQLGL